MADVEAAALRGLEAGEEGDGGGVEEFFGGAEGRGLPAVVVEVLSPVYADDVPGDHAALHHEAGDEGIGLALLDAQETPGFLDADAAVLGQVFQNLLLGGVRLVFGKGLPIVAELPVPFYRGKGGLAAQEELAVRHFSALDAGNLPVPGGEAEVFLRVEPIIGRGHFLNGIARDFVFEEGNYAQFQDGVQHGLRANDTRRPVADCFFIEGHY